MTLGLLVDLENTNKHTHIQDSCFISIRLIWIDIVKPENHVDNDKRFQKMKNLNLPHQFFENGATLTSTSRVTFPSLAQWAEGWK